MGDLVAWETIARSPRASSAWRETPLAGPRSARPPRARSTQVLSRDPGRREPVAAGELFPEAQRAPRETTRSGAGSPETPGDTYRAKSCDPPAGRPRATGGMARREWKIQESVMKKSTAAIVLSAAVFLLLLGSPAFAAYPPGGPTAVASDATVTPGQTITIWGRRAGEFDRPPVPGQPVVKTAAVDPAASSTPLTIPSTAKAGQLPWWWARSHWGRRRGHDHADGARSCRRPATAASPSPARTSRAG